MLNFQDYEIIHRHGGNTTRHIKGGIGVKAIPFVMKIKIPSKI